MRMCSGPWRQVSTATWSNRWILPRSRPCCADPRADPCADLTPCPSPEGEGKTPGSPPMGTGTLCCQGTNEFQSVPPTEETNVRFMEGLEHVSTVVRRPLPLAAGPGGAEPRSARGHRHL